jgi:hypothetical protein
VKGLRIWNESISNIHGGEEKIRDSTLLFGEKVVSLHAVSD